MLRSIMGTLLNERPQIQQDGQHLLGAARRGIEPCLSNVRLLACITKGIYRQNDSQHPEG